MDDPTAGLRARLTRPGKGAPGKDVNLPLAGSVVPMSKRPAGPPDVLGALGKAAEGLKTVRALSRSATKGGR